MDAFIHDVRSAVRSLTKARGFTAVAVLVFALGIGLNTALFSIVNAAFFRPLPVAAPENLVYIYRYSVYNKPMPAVGPADYEAFRDHTSTFDGTTLATFSSSSLTIDDQTERVPGEIVTANYFDVLGIKPAAGRTFRPDDDVISGGEFAIVISHRLWVRLFNSDPDIVGRTVRLCCRTVFAKGAILDSDADFTVVGVAPPEFRGIPGRFDPWTPTDFWATYAHTMDRRVGAGLLIARLKDGATYDQARSEVAIQGARLIDEQVARAARPDAREAMKKQRYHALRANDVRTPFDPTAVLVPPRLVTAMVVVVAMVLLIAGSNIAGLLISRGVTRTGETAIRLVLGARPVRIVRQLLAETLVLALAGGVFGLLLASWLLWLFRTYTPNRFALDVPIDGHVLLFTAVVCLATGIVTGIAPALQALRINLLSALPGIAVRTTRDVQARLRQWIVVPQVALCLVLLLAAGFQVRALMNVELTDAGYNVRDRVILTIGRRSPPGENRFNPALGEQRAERTRLFFREVLARLEGIAGVPNVALTSGVPVNAGINGTDVIAQDDYLNGARTGVDSVRTAIGPGYFATMGIRLLRGRDFDEREVPDSKTWWSRPPLAIVSENLARRLWRGRDPIGRFLALDAAEATDGKVVWHEVIGVVNDTDPVLREKGEAPVVYVALGQQWLPNMNLVIARVGPDSGRMIADLKRAVTGADPFAEVYAVRTFDQVVGELLYPRRMAAALLTAAGLTGLFLAVTGLYGVVSYSVARRVHEMGVRATLGARRIDIIRHVLGEGLRTALMGSVFGFALTYIGVRLTSDLVGGVPVVDPVVLFGVPMVLLGVILLACYIPARRAARVDPLESLRTL